MYKIGTKFVLFGEICILCQVEESKAALISFKTGRMLSQSAIINEKGACDICEALPTSSEIKEISERFHPDIYLRIKNLEILSDNQKSNHVGPGINKHKDTSSKGDFGEYGSSSLRDAPNQWRDD